mgnify:CR=1 FL=1
MVLAADSLMGRAPFTIGEAKTLAYLQQRMDEIGLEPAFDGSYLQEVPLAEITSHIPSSVNFSAKGEGLTFSVGHDVGCWSPMLKE